MHILVHYTCIMSLSLIGIGDFSFAYFNAELKFAEVNTFFKFVEQHFSS